MTYVSVVEFYGSAVVMGGTLGILLGWWWSSRNP